AFYLNYLYGIKIAEIGGCDLGNGAGAKVECIVFGMDYSSLVSGLWTTGYTMIYFGMPWFAFWIVCALIYCLVSLTNKLRQNNT
ncbi:MAG: hypothetical protein AAGF54_20860, partial [Pseudomonadota bacterium]